MRKPKNNLAYLRMQNYLSQKEIATILQISQVYYSKLENNPEKISLGMAQKLKNILRAQSIDDFLKKVI
ncbi:helix-turn-helix domain-containing protein [Paenibacillus urinalis]|uniref:helix-turn-helix domain-containing protein n=1 Tax=Paenibacillus urinalis TaxID=521520 RepID=UPI00195FBC92